MTEQAGRGDEFSILTFLIPENSNNILICAETSRMGSRACNCAGLLLLILSACLFCFSFRQSIIYM